MQLGTMFVELAVTLGVLVMSLGDELEVVERCHVRRGSWLVACSSRVQASTMILGCGVVWMSCFHAQSPSEVDSDADLRLNNFSRGARFPPTSDLVWGGVVAEKPSVGGRLPRDLHGKCRYIFLRHQTSRIAHHSHPSCDLLSPPSPHHHCTPAAASGLARSAPPRCRPFLPDFSRN
jgi:hypothetical protein